VNRLLSLNVLLAFALTTSAQGQISDAEPIPPARAVAITFDDLPVVSAVDQSLSHLQRVTTQLLQAIRTHAVPAIGFVNEGKLWSRGELVPQRVAILRQWLTAGLELGNHTYSHVDLHAAPLQEVKAAVAHGEVQLRALMTADRQAPRYFRHPYLRTGRDPETRRSFESFLAERGYRVAPVTFDNADYIFAAAYDRAVARGDASAAARIVDTYVDYMRRVVIYYEQQSMALFRREIPQVLLLHANALNATAFDAIARMLRSRHYAFVELDRVLMDAAYRSDDSYYGPGGISWIHRWALTEGKGPEFFAGEPEVPAWVTQAAARAR
jgi:peptidoglycan/xylan/chitin deacetylase (PgdA/CDA1 family)